MERSEPILQVHNLAEARRFYKAMGFEPWFREGDYEIMSRGHLVVHLEENPDVVPAENRASCYLRVKDADQLYRDVSEVGLPSEGIPRITPLEDEAWGMREFTLKDPSGNLLRIGMIATLPRPIRRPIPASHRNSMSDGGLAVG